MSVTEILNAIISALHNTSMIEWCILITALLYVLLATIENSWCWLFGIIASGLSIYLCYSGQLFLESGLQLFYVVIGVYGWYQWLHGSSKKTAVHITSFTFKKNSYLILLGCIIWVPMGVIAHHYSTQAMPYLDAFITSFSLLATWMTAKKILENWIYWIVIDGLSIWLYASREFYLIALLYMIYTLLAIIGYIQWRKKLT